MNTNDFRKNLVTRFIAGFDSNTSHDGFHILNVADIEICYSEHNGFSLKENDFGMNEQRIYNAVQNFIIDLEVGLNASGIEIPKHLKDVFKNDIDFYDDFVSEVMNICK